MSITVPKKKLPRLILLGSLMLPLLSACNNGPDTSEALPHLSRADTYAEQGQYRSAILEIRNAIQTEPDNVAHIARLAEMYLQVSANKQATDLLEPWLKDAPQVVALPLARAYVEQRKHLSAMETLALATPETDSKKLEAALIKAEALRLSSGPDEALAAFQDISNNNPANVEAITGVLQSQLQLRNSSAALAAANDWLASNETTPAILHLKGAAQYQLDDLESATATLTDAVTGLPTSDMFLPLRGEILTLLARVLTEQGKITEAQVYSRILAERTDSGSREQSEAAISAIRAGNFDEAKTILRDMRKIDPDNEQLALMLGTLTAGTGELKEGAELLSENLDPETSPTRFIRASTMAQIDLGKREEALATLDRAVKARSDDNDLLAMHGILALSMPGQEAAGVTSLSKAISNEPERTRLRVALARHYINSQQTDQALSQLRTAFTTQPADWASTAIYLSLLIDSGETREAEDVRDSLINGYGNQPQALLLAAIADGRMGNSDLAIIRLEQLAVDNPDMQPARLALANLYASVNSPDKAVEQFLAAAVITPNVIGPLQQATQTYGTIHNVEEVQQWLSTVADTHPPLAPNSSLLSALIDIQQGNLEQARTILEPMANEDNPIGYRAYGQLLAAEAVISAQAEDYSTALAKAAEAITIQPDSVSIALLPARILITQGKNAEALEALQAAAETHNNHVTILMAQADLQMNQQQNQPAIELYEQVVTAQPNNVVALNNLAWLLREQNNSRAIELAGRASKLAPNAPDILDTHGWVLHLGGDHEQAKVIIEKALALAPENAEIQTHLKTIKAAM
ncbi:tetratricopeptide repeat protein [Marinobacter sp. LV10R520-4]|uniref:tetratricopeptide repeat protein n=1 Tax=Marinobacter sp. LV10R520-4 TaxID=1761796 RepID=UPI000BF6597A|nr:tetratricopeptide repeat protein [Marinobacter sp. LV10R520-4]PFG54804.1 tetratricopeptide repeat protein [Marinobacter sp. LV10R520-4]